MDEIKISKDVMITDYEDEVKIEKRQRSENGSYFIETIWLTKSEAKKLKQYL